MCVCASVADSDSVVSTAHLLSYFHTPSQIFKTVSDLTADQAMQSLEYATKIGSILFQDKDASLDLSALTDMMSKLMASFGLEAFKERLRKLDSPSKGAELIMEHAGEKDSEGNAVLKLVGFTKVFTSLLGRLKMSAEQQRKFLSSLT